MDIKMRDGVAEEVVWDMIEDVFFFLLFFCLTSYAFDLIHNIFPYEFIVMINLITDILDRQFNIDFRVFCIWFYNTVSVDRELREYKWEGYVGLETANGGFTAIWSNDVVVELWLVDSFLRWGLPGPGTDALRPNTVFIRPCIVN